MLGAFGNSSQVFGLLSCSWFWSHWAQHSFEQVELSLCKDAYYGVYRFEVVYFCDDVILFCCKSCANMN